MALGGEPRRVRVLILARGVKLGGAGIMVGVIGALFLTRFMENLLFELTPLDPLTFGAVTLLLLITAVLASYLPARRATRVDPMVALRAE